jgi:hypothetical protein
MGVPGNANALLLKQAAAAGGYEISRSVRFSSSDSAFLSRTPASSSNRKTWTWAGWVKRGNLSGTYDVLFSAGPASSGARLGFTLYLNRLNLDFYGSGDILVTAQVLRDPSAWYHIVLAFDSTQSSAGDRAKVYVNGSRVTAFSTSPNITQNADYPINGAVLHEIGRFSSGEGYYFDGCLADVFLIDGQQLDPSSFGEFDTNNVWQPKAYSGSYGTNGFHLPFSDNSTAAALGTDTSGNGNTWTVNNISVAAGAGNDSLRDSPTNGSQTDTGVGGEVVGNYCTLNPLDLSANISLTNGNLDAAVASGSSSKNIRSTIFPASGKWYWEMTNGTVSTFNMIGIASRAVSLTSGAALNQTGGYAYGSDGNFYSTGTADPTPATFTSGDVIGCAWDISAGTLQFYKNGISQGTISSIPSGEYAPAFTVTSGSDSFSANWGARPFAYTAPSGFKALCTTNLPEPTIADGSTVMDVKLYTGNGSTQTISGLNFSPDLVWIKGRSLSGTQHQLTDVVRGTSKSMSTNSTAAESTLNTVTSFNSDGFTLGNESDVNFNTLSCVAWTWDAGSSTVTNTQGSISSQVRANASAGFSVVTYSGDNSTSGSVGHGLGVAPSMVIIKARNASKDWKVAHVSLPAQYMLSLNETYAANIAGWDGVTSTVFKPARVGDTYNNTSGQNYVAYCFAPVAGYSSFGSYTGNGSADGPFVFCNFRPRWIMWKRTDAAQDWVTFDAPRGPINPNSTYLWPNLSDAELTASASVYGLDMLSNGWKIRGTSTYFNASGGTYVFAAFAEHPFQYARAR